MSILLDTGVLYARLHEHDDHHKEARRLEAECMEGLHGAVFVTDDIVDELLTLIQARGGHLEMARGGASLVGLVDEEAPLATAVRVTERLRAAAWELFQRHYERGLSFTDCTTLAVIEDRHVDRLATFDDGFHGLVPVAPEPA